MKRFMMVLMMVCFLSTNVYAFGFGDLKGLAKGVSDEIEKAVQPKSAESETAKPVVQQKQSSEPTWEETRELNRQRNEQKRLAHEQRIVESDKRKADERKALDEAYAARTAEKVAAQEKRDVQEQLDIQQNAVREANIIASRPEWKKINTYSLKNKFQYNGENSNTLWARKVNKEFDAIAYDYLESNPKDFDARWGPAVFGAKEYAMGCIASRIGDSPALKVKNDSELNRLPNRNESIIDYAACMATTRQALRQ